MRGDPRLDVHVAGFGDEGDHVDLGGPTLEEALLQVRLLLLDYRLLLVLLPFPATGKTKDASFGYEIRSVKTLVRKGPRN